MDMASSITRHRNESDVVACPGARTWRARRRNADIRGCLTQDVTHAAHGVDQPRFSFGLGLPAQIADIHLEGVARGREVETPHLLEDAAAGEHRRGLAISISSRANSVRVRLMDRLPRCTSRVTGSSVRSENVITAESPDRRGRAAQQRPHPGQQLLERERLRQVVVGAGVQAGHPLGDRVRAVSTRIGRSSPVLRS
jgi:hypothetical protein